MKAPTNLENISESVAANAVATLISAVAGTPLSALLPLLTSSLASKRHFERVESAMKEIEAGLVTQKTAVKNLSDGQFKLINELLLSVHRTVDDGKLAILKDIIVALPRSVDISLSDAEVLARILNTITLPELQFIRSYFAYRHIWLFKSSVELGEKDPPPVFLNEKRSIYTKSNTGDLYIEPASEEASVVAGLIGLGVLCQLSVGSIDPVYGFTGLASKILSLAQDA